MQVTSLNYKQVLPENLWSRFIQMSPHAYGYYIVYEDGMLKYKEDGSLAK